MIITTTSTVEGRQIVEYHGVVFGEVIAGVNFVKDFFANVRNFVGGSPTLMNKSYARHEQMH